MGRANRAAKRRRAQVDATQQSELYQRGAGLRGGEARARLQTKLWKRKLDKWSRVGDSAEKLEALKRAGINLEEFDLSSVFRKDGDGVEGDASTEPPFVLETGGETFRVHAPPEVLEALWKRLQELREKVADLAKEYGLEPSQSDVNSLAELLNEAIAHIMCFDPDTDDHLRDGKTNKANVCVGKVIGPHSFIKSTEKCGEIAEGDAEKNGGWVLDIYPILMRRKDDNGHSINPATEFRRVCGGAERADALMELHLEATSVTFLICELAHGEKLAVATWGEDACAAMEAVFGDAVNNLGRHIHPMAGTLIYRGMWGSLDFEKHIVASDRCLTAIAKHLGMTVLGADDEINYWRRLYAKDADVIEGAKEEM